VDYESLRNRIITGLDRYIKDVSLFYVIMDDSLYIRMVYDDEKYSLTIGNATVEDYVDDENAFIIIYNSVYKGNSVIGTYAQSVW
jgi:hypothetical protein